MKRIEWVIAIAAAFLTPATVQAQANTAVPQATQNQMTADQTGTGGATAAATTPSSMPTAAPANAAPIPGTPGHMLPTPGIGQPDGRIGIQDQFNPTGVEAEHFHNYWLMPLITGITLLVLVLLGIAMVRFRRGANPTPSRTSHNTFIEVIWTVLPVLILVAIAIPSIRLMRAQYSFPKPDLTVKVIGNQWYWTYQYPDNGGFEVVSNILKEKSDPNRQPSERYRTDADGPPLLSVDNRMVIPAGKVVKFLVTSNDVIHSFSMPSFWTKIDANPGQINETWVKVDRPGVYFGQCQQLCGAGHGFMPIVIEVEPPAQFAQWVASKGGTMPGATPAPTPASLSTGAAAATPQAAVATAAPQPTPPTSSADQSRQHQ
jgi:cytochrome c oxidase subunit II